MKTPKRVPLHPVRSQPSPELEETMRKLSIATKKVAEDWQAKIGPILDAFAVAGRNHAANMEALRKKCPAMFNA